jgi:VWFA-related protein
MAGMKCALLVAFAGALAAQPSRFGVRSRLVLVPTTVTDANGRSIDGLEASNFLVYDNGHRVRVGVDTIDTGVAPIALIIAVQTSGISAAALEKARHIGSMIQPHVTGERGCGGLVTFAEHVAWLAECTKDADVLGRAFDKLAPEEHNKGRMLDAVAAAVDRLKKQPNARRILLLISESRDRGSETKLEAATVAAQTAGVTVYALTYSAFRTAFTSKAPVSRPKEKNEPKTPVKDAQDTFGTWNGQPASKYNPKTSPPAAQRPDLLAGIQELAHLSMENSAEVLTAATGGRTFSFTRQKALEEGILKLGAEIHSQYLLSFAPVDSTPGYHRLEVRLARPDAHIRARPGYWPAEDTK